MFIKYMQCFYYEYSKNFIHVFAKLCISLLLINTRIYLFKMNIITNGYFRNICLLFQFFYKYVIWSYTFAEKVFSDIVNNNGFRFRFRLRLANRCSYWASSACLKIIHNRWIFPSVHR